MTYQLETNIFMLYRKKKIEWKNSEMKNFPKKTVLIAALEYKIKASTTLDTISFGFCPLLMKKGEF